MRLKRLSNVLTVTQLSKWWSQNSNLDMSDSKILALLIIMVHSFHWLTRAFSQQIKFFYLAGCSHSIQPKSAFHILKVPSVHWGFQDNAREESFDSFKTLTLLSAYSESLGLKERKKEILRVNIIRTIFKALPTQPQHIVHSSQDSWAFLILKLPCEAKDESAACWFSKFVWVLLSRREKIRKRNGKEGISRKEVGRMKSQILIYCFQTRNPRSPSLVILLGWLFLGLPRAVLVHA